MIIKDNVIFQKDIEYNHKYNIIKFFKYDSLNDNGNGQTEYTFYLKKNMKCDVLIVGGGGGGGTSYSDGSTVPGGGGGAGGLIFLKNQLLDIGTYTVKVGKGGNGDIYTDISYQIGTNGSNSSFSYLQSEAIGGGGGGSRYGKNIGNNGGSGGGSVVGGTDGDLQGIGGNGTITNIIKADGTIIIDNYKQGSNGGTSQPYQGNGIIDEAPYVSGGGGAYEDGISNRIGDSTELDGDLDSNGGNGKYDSIGNGTGEDFKLLFDIIDTTIGHHHTDGKVYFAGGGAGGYRPAVPGSDETTNVRNSENNHSFGGLGGGASSNDGDGNNGMPNTGGGGSGSRSHKTYPPQTDIRSNGGNGGSGIVILRFYNDENISLNTILNLVIDEKNLIFDI